MGGAEMEEADGRSDGAEDANDNVEISYPSEETCRPA